MNVYKKNAGEPPIKANEGIEKFKVELKGLLDQWRAASDAVKKGGAGEEKRKAVVGRYIMLIKELVVCCTKEMQNALLFTLVDLDLEYNDCRKVFELLMKEGGDVNAVLKAENGESTPFIHYAIIRQKEDLAIDALLRGARVNEADCKGFLPLHWASYFKMYKLMELLIIRGARVNACSDANEDRKTACDLVNDKLEADSKSTKKMSEADKKLLIAARSLLKKKSKPPIDSKQKTVAGTNTYGTPNEIFYRAYEDNDYGTILEFCREITDLTKLATVLGEIHDKDIVQFFEIMDRLAIVIDKEECTVNDKIDVDGLRLINRGLRLIDRAIIEKNRHLVKVLLLMNASADTKTLNLAISHGTFDMMLYILIFGEAEVTDETHRLFKNKMFSQPERWGELLELLKCYNKTYLDVSASTATAAAGADRKRDAAPVKATAAATPSPAAAWAVADAKTGGSVQGFAANTAVISVPLPVPPAQLRAPELFVPSMPLKIDASASHNVAVAAPPLTMLASPPNSSTSTLSIVSSTPHSGTFPIASPTASPTALISPLSMGGALLSTSATSNRGSMATSKNEDYGGCCSCIIA